MIGETFTRGPWSVILELPGKQLVVVSTHRKHSDASAMVWKVAEQYRMIRGARVYLQTKDSADQVQVSARGDAFRDQPELLAVGEDVTVYVPTATAKAGVPNADPPLA